MGCGSAAPKVPTVAPLAATAASKEAWSTVGVKENRVPAAHGGGPRMEVKVTPPRLSLPGKAMNEFASFAAGPSTSTSDAPQLAHPTVVNAGSDNQAPRRHSDSSKSSSDSSNSGKEEASSSSAPLNANQKQGDSPNKNPAVRRASANWGKAVDMIKANSLPAESSDDLGEDSTRNAPRMLGRRRSDSSLLHGGGGALANIALTAMARVSPPMEDDEEEGPPTKTPGRRRSMNDAPTSSGGPKMMESTSGAVLGRRRSAGNACAMGMQIGSTSVATNQKGEALGRRQKMGQIINAHDACGSPKKRNNKFQ